MDALLELLGSLARLVDSLTDLVTDSPWTYLLILALAAFDAVLPILPGESVVLVAAVLAGAGRLDLLSVALAAGVGAFLGDNLAYAVGRLAGRPLVLRLMRGREERLHEVAAQFEARGGSLIVVGRFVPGGRTAVAIGAGVLHYPWPRYALFASAAAALWALQASVPGYVGGVLFADRPWLGLLIGAALAIALALAIELVRRRRLASEARARAGAASGPPGPRLDASRVASLGPAGPPHRQGEDDEADAGPGAHRGGGQPELADPQEVTDPRPEGLAQESAQAGRAQHGQDMPSAAPADEQVRGGVEGAHEDGQDETRAQDGLERVAGHRPTRRPRRSDA